MTQYNANDLAVDVCSEEGKAEELSIAQVKETIKSIGKVLIRKADGDVVEAAALFSALVLEREAKEYAKKA